MAHAKTQRPKDKGNGLIDWEKLGVFGSPREISYSFHHES